MQLLCGDYAQEFNVRHGFTGHLFQGRFGAEVVTHERHVFEAIRYVDSTGRTAGIGTVALEQLSGARAARGAWHLQTRRMSGASERAGGSAAVAYERLR